MVQEILYKADVQLLRIAKLQMLGLDLLKGDLMKGLK